MALTKRGADEPDCAGAEAAVSNWRSLRCTGSLSGCSPGSGTVAGFVGRRETAAGESPLAEYYACIGAKA